MTASFTQGRRIWQIQKWLLVQLLSEIADLSRSLYGQGTLLNVLGIWLNFIFLQSFCKKHSNCFSWKAWTPYSGYELTKNKKSMASLLHSVSVFALSHSFSWQSPCNDLGIKKGQEWSITFLWQGTKTPTKVGPFAGPPAWIQIRTLPEQGLR
jgi:hypothetical protein